MTVGGFKVALNSCCLGRSPFSAGVGIRVTDGCGREVASKALRKIGLPRGGPGEAIGDSAVLSGDHGAASHLHRFSLAWLLVLFGQGCPEAAVAPPYPGDEP